MKTAEEKAECWLNDNVAGWALDERNSSRRILSELVLLQQDFIVNIGFLENDTVLSRAFEID